MTQRWSQAVKVDKALINAQAFTEAVYERLK